jgi:hypothetical protein
MQPRAAGHAWRAGFYDKTRGELQKIGSSWADFMIEGHCCWSSAAQQFFVSSPTGLISIFYSLTFLWVFSAPYRQNRFQELLYWLTICCRGNVRNVSQLKYVPESRGNRNENSLCWRGPAATHGQSISRPLEDKRDNPSWIWKTLLIFAFKR